MSQRQRSGADRGVHLPDGRAHHLRDPTRYRLADETEAWKLLDPIERVRVHLVRGGLADQAFFDGVDNEAAELAARFRAFCMAMPKPAVDRMFDHVYTDPHDQTQRQRAELMEYLAGFDDVDTEPPASGAGTDMATTKQILRWARP